MSTRTKPVQIADTVWWVGAHNTHNQLYCNPYLIVDGGTGILVDPGSVLDFEYVFKNVAAVIDPKAISHFVLHHQDPDLCSAVPLFEQRGIIRPVVTHWRSSVISHYYGIKGAFYLVDRHEYRLSMPSGRVLHFLHTPYLHFPGSMVTYDPATETLFSSDLFGAFYIDEDLQELFAGPSYMEAMKAFHEHYMPGNELLRPVMDTFLNMSIKCIAPQHGSIIRKDIVSHIRALRDLECGLFIRPIRKELAHDQGYVEICNDVLRRCHAIAGVHRTVQVFEGTDIVLDPNTGYVNDFSTSGVELWHNLFRIMESRGGVGWLSALEVLVKKVAAEYAIPMPDVYASSLVDITRQAADSDKRYREQKVLSERLSQNIEETRDQLTHDVTSGLYNADFFRKYLHNELQYEENRTGAFLLLSIDNLQRINFKYGTVQGDDVVRSCGLLIQEHTDESMMLARLEGALFGIYMPGVSLEQAVKWAETCRTVVAKSSVFIEMITLSIGLVHTAQAPATAGLAPELIHFLHSTAGMRVRIAKKRGANYVCSDSSMETYSEKSGKVLVVDTERINIDILSTMLRQMDLSVECAGDGDEALVKIEQFNPDIVISEIMIPKIDGFGVRERMMELSLKKHKTFILVSHLKDEELVRRAHKLQIMHYFKKPYLLSELVGLVKNILRKPGAV